MEAICHTSERVVSDFHISSKFVLHIFSYLHLVFVVLVFFLKNLQQNHLAIQGISDIDFEQFHDEIFLREFAMHVMKKRKTSPLLMLISKSRKVA